MEVITLQHGIWQVFAWLFPCLLPLLALSHIHVFVVRLLGRRITLCLGVIGVPLHELAHLITALLCGHKIDKVSLYSPRSDGSLGFVVHSFKRRWYTPVALLMIGLAPLVGGYLSFMAVTYVLRPDLFALLSQLASSEGKFYSNTSWWAFTVQAFTGALPAVTATWCIVSFSILLFCVPSRSDFQGCKSAVVVLAVLAVVLSCFASSGVQILQILETIALRLAYPLWFAVISLVLVSLFILAFRFVHRSILLAFSR